MKTQNWLTLLLNTMHVMTSKTFTIIIVSLLSMNSFAQQHSKALAKADSTNFSINKKDGWQLFNSCVKTVSKDSVMIGLILQHDRSIDWEREQQIGRIKSKSFIPKSEQTLSFQLLTNFCKLRIDTNGKCYLSLIPGALPDEMDPLIIPVKVVFKN